MNEPVPEVEGDFIPIRVTFDRDLYVICAGDGYESTVRVQVNEHWCGLFRGKWTSPPIPYHPGMEVVVKLIDGQGRAKEIRTHLPGPDALGPVYGTEWEGFPSEQPD